MPQKAAQHRPARTRGRETRGTAAQRGYDYRWQRYRRWYLSLPENVVCRECRRAVASEVDHIQPHRGNEELFWDTRNHQPLCKSCHSSKTRTGQ